MRLHVPNQGFVLDLPVRVFLMGCVQSGDGVSTSMTRQERTS